MRVAIVHNLLSGGAHRRLREHALRLGGDLVEVCLASADPVTGDPVIVPFAPRAPRVPAALRVPLRYSDLGELVLAWRRAAARVRALRVEVVYANPCRYLQAPPLLSAKLAPSLYFCDEPRRVDHDPSATGSRRRLTRPVYAAMYSLERRLDAGATAAASRLATNSAFTAAAIATAYGRRADVVPMGVAEAFLRAGAHAPPRGEAGGTRHVLSVGTLIPAKGHELALLAAARAARPRPVVVVGPRAEPAEAARLQALAASHGVALSIRTGISDPELATLYAGAHATVYMARREPFGLASLEAQAAGSPVVLAAEGGLPETLAPGQEHWAVARDPAAVAARLDELEDADRRDRAVAAGREHAQGLTWERSAQGILALLQKLSA